jgi:hypothetical protein
LIRSAFLGTGVRKPNAMSLVKWLPPTGKPPYARPRRVDKPPS